MLIELGYWKLGEYIYCTFMGKQRFITIATPACSNLTVGGFRCPTSPWVDQEEKYDTKTNGHVQPNTTAEGGIVCKSIN